MLENVFDVFAKNEILKVENGFGYFSTGIKSLDNLVKGFDKSLSEVYLIASLRSIGTTALTIQLVKALLSQGESSIVYLAFDDGSEQISKRFILSDAKVRIQDFDNQSISKEDETRIEASCKKFKKSNCLISDTINDLNEIELVLKTTHARFLVVDSLDGLMKDERQNLLDLIYLCRRLGVSLIVTYRFDRYKFEPDMSSNLQFHTQLVDVFGPGITKMANVLFLNCTEEYYESLDDPRFDLRIVEVFSNKKGCTGITHILRNEYTGFIDVPDEMVEEYDLLI